ncbi:MAG: leucine-rich repeat domain-containing protein [Clostridiales bacterium]|nr:leucine-rich repeat domain-containing protein [Clostridiales bacterium]
MELVAGWELPAASAVVLPGNTKTIGASAFAGAKTIVSVSIPYGCTAIGENAFQNCSGLSRIVIPASVTEIKTTAFDGCRDVLVFGLNKEPVDLTKESMAETFFKSKEGFAYVIPVD